MSNLIRLKKYNDSLCEELNINGYKLSSGLPYESYEEPYTNLTILAICRDVDAYNHLMEKGMIRKDLCAYCGESPISNTFKYTEPVNKIVINICQKCHAKGRKAQEIRRSLTSKRGCLSIVLSLLLILLSLTVLIY